MDVAAYIEFRDSGGVQLKVDSRVLIMIWAMGLRRIIIPRVFSVNMVIGYKIGVAKVPFWIE